MSIANNSTVTGQTFTNQRVDVSGSSGVTFSGCTFVNASIYFNGATDLTITGCTFRDGPTQTAITGYMPTRVKVLACIFINVSQPLHWWFGFQTNRQDCEISDCTVTGFSRNGFELQQSARGLKILRNRITGHTASIADGGGMAISCATGANTTGTIIDAIDVVIQDNVLDISGALPKIDTALLENMGNGNIVNRNLLVGGNIGILYTETNMTPGNGWTATNNWFIADTNTLESESDGLAGTTIIPPRDTSGNKTFASLQAAGFNALPTVAQWMAVNGSGGVQASQPPAPSTTLQLTATVIDANTVKLIWPTAVQSPVITIVSTVGRQAFPSIKYTDSRNSATICNVHAGWQLDFSVTGSNAVTLQMPGNSSAPYSGNPKGIVGTTTATLTTYTDGTTDALKS